jgi:hypothetical protein
MDVIDTSNLTKDRWVWWYISWVIEITPNFQVAIFWFCGGWSVFAWLEWYNFEGCEASGSDDDKFCPFSQHVPCALTRHFSRSSVVDFAYDSALRVDEALEASLWGWIPLGHARVGGLYFIRVYQLAEW